MAFNIRSRAGWHRLWLVAAALWALIVIVMTAATTPTASDIELSRQKALARLTPSAIAIRNHEIINNAQLVRSMGHQPEPLITPEDAKHRIASTNQTFDDALVNLRSNQIAGIFANLKIWLLVSLLAYASGWLAVGAIKVCSWVIRGFTVR